jgi:c-di-GMP-binding flagellar brake protein YcgR
MDARQRRRHVRVGTDRPVGVRVVDRVTGEPSRESVTASVRDISAGGALLVTAAPVPRGKNVELEIVWTDPALSVSLRARIVRMTALDGGMEVSVEFERADWMQRLDIVRWVLKEAKRTNQMSDRVA